MKYFKLKITTLLFFIFLKPSISLSQSEIVFEKIDGGEVIIQYNENLIVENNSLEENILLDTRFNNYPTEEEDREDYLFVSSGDFSLEYLSPEIRWMMVVQDIKKDYGRIERLLKNGQNVDAPIIDSNNMLILGAMQKNLTQVNLALKYKANINKTNNDGETALHWSIINQDVAYRLLQENLNNKDPKAFINKKNKEGRTALHFAATYRPDDMVIDLLINNGALIDSTDKNGRTPAYYAAAFENWIALEPLARRGANLMLKDDNDVSTEELIIRKANIKNMLKFYPYLSIEGKNIIKEKLNGYVFEEGEVNPFKK